MNQNVFITNTPGGALSTAYLVELGSGESDPSRRFGIKRLDTGEVVVEDSTPVSNPSTGLYEYTFDAIPNVMYLISWRIIQNDGDDPTYTQETTGPFFDSSTVRSVAEFRGTFLQNTCGTFYLRLMALDGSPIDAEDINLTVSNTSSVAFSAVPEKIKAGFYMYDWPVPPTQQIGSYDVLWTFTVGGQTRSTLENIVVAQNTPNAYFTIRQLTLKMALDALIPTIQSIGINSEPAKDSHDLRTYSFSFPRWNSAAGVNVYRNNTLMTHGFVVNYQRGSVTFDVPNLPEDTISADYNFRYFDDYELTLFLTNGVNAINIYPPQTAYTIYDVPDLYVPPTLYEAAVNAIRTYQMKLLLPQNRIIYETKEQADKAFDQLGEVKKEYSDKCEKLSDQKKLFPYRGLTATIITPLFTLPGGRARFFRYLFGAGF